jgi:carbamate kinase
MRRTVLIAIGGNALIPAGEAPAVATERAHVRAVCDGIAEIAAAGWRVVLTHGNGPQVGAAMARSERSAADTYPLPLDVCVACTQGEIGLLLLQALAEALASRGLHRPVATVLSQVVVRPDDPAFSQPTKPIGPFYSQRDLAALQPRGWRMAEEPPRGWRRVVPSPEPVAIVEEASLRALVDAGVIVIALGGGGVPVVREGHRLAGVDAVVDKDAASALLATRLGLDRLLLATDVDHVYLDFGSADARPLCDTTAEELQRYAETGQFPAGSMGPKVAAALRFVSAGGEAAIIAGCDRLAEALEGRAGTHVRLGDDAGAHPTRRRRATAG